MKNNVLAIRAALEAAGVQFLDNGDMATGTGVVLCERSASSVDARAKLAVAC